MTKFDMVTHIVERELVLGVSHALGPRGGPQRSPIFAFPSIYVFTVLRRTTKFGVVTHIGRDLFQGQPTPLHIAQICREVCQR